ncbi:hemagglutinin/amebocyte aggregation factor-like [Montipora foliosa]|uniref:hemagglutinin/amebocyte aggregation factor-like n=1 Tax=Montipora foliosa TaxID=591990 RepID=UPI0035F12FBB
MKGNKLAFFLLLVLVFEILFFTATEANPWWSSGRRRRRRCSSSSPAGVAWVNGWQQYFSVKCGNSYSIRTWRSIHRNCKEDRIHYFQCSYGPMSYQEKHCSHTANYANDYDGKLSFKCPHNGFIAGVRSTYSGHHKDRKFSFRCCHKDGYCAHTCKLTPTLNNWDQEINYSVPWGYYLVGAHSSHHNSYEDRKWEFEICKFTKSKHCKGK